MRLRAPYLFGAVMVLVAGVASLAWAQHPDTWWHLRTGAWILDHGRLPSTDLWSATAAGRHWVPREWLGDVFFAGAFRALGHPGVSLLRALLVTACLGAVAVQCYRRTTPYAAAAVLLLTMAATSSEWTARPQLFSLVLLVPVAARLRAATVRDDVRVWPLIPAIWLWANLHGYWIVAVLVAATGAAGALLDGGRRRAARLGLLAAAFVAVAGATPNGPALLSLHVPRPTGATLDWGPPSVRSPAGLAFAMLLVLVAAGWARDEQRVPWPEVLYVALATCIGLTAMRTVAVGAVLLAPVAARRTRHLQPRLAACVAAAAAVGVIAAGLGRVAPRDTPSAAVHYLRASGVRRVVNEYEIGGWLLWVAPGEIRPAIDGRSGLYGKRYTRDYTDALALRGDWAQVVDGGHPDAALLHPDTPLVNGLLTSGWQRAPYADPEWVILLPPR